MADGSFAQICDVTEGAKVLTLDGPAGVVGNIVIPYDGFCYSLAIGSVDEIAGSDYPTDAAIYFRRRNRQRRSYGDALLYAASPQRSRCHSQTRAGKPACGLQVCLWGSALLIGR